METSVPDGPAEPSNYKVSAGEARGAIEVLLEAFDQFTDAGRLEVAEEREHLTRSVFGWWAWINGSSRLVILGHDAGLGHETAPNARSILEHTLVMQWVVDIGDDAMAAVAAKADESRRKLFDDVQQAGWTIPAGVNRPDPPTEPPKLGMLNFADLCRAYDAGILYIPYRTMSAHVHPSAKGAEAYLDHETAILHSYATRRTDGDLVLVAICLVWAAQTIDFLALEKPLSGAITEACTRIGQHIERPTLRPIPSSPD